MSGAIDHTGLAAKLVERHLRPHRTDPLLKVLEPVLLEAIDLGWGDRTDILPTLQHVSALTFELAQTRIDLEEARQDLAAAHLEARQNKEILRIVGSGFIGARTARIVRSIWPKMRRLVRT